MNNESAPAEDAAKREEVAELLTLWMTKPEVPVYAVLSDRAGGPTICYRGVLYGMLSSLRVNLCCDDPKSAVAGMNLQLDQATSVQASENPHAYVENGKRVPGKLISAEWRNGNNQSVRSMRLYHGFNPFDFRNASMDGDSPLYVG